MFTRNFEILFFIFRLYNPEQVFSLQVFQINKEREKTIYHAWGAIPGVLRLRYLAKVESP